MIRSLKSLNAALKSLKTRASHPDDEYIHAACVDAIATAEEGNFGVGALLVDDKGCIVSRGRNRVFRPHFRSDLHAEMDAMNQYEDAQASRPRSRLEQFVMYTTLEPCPMCTARLITAGVGTVKFGAPDKLGGMASRIGQLPPVWTDLASGITFTRADCSPELSELCFAIFAARRKVLDGQIGAPVAARSSM